MEKSIAVFKDKFLSFLEVYGPKIIISIVFLFISLIVIKFFMKFLEKALKRSKLDPICHKFFLSLIKITLYVLLGIICLSILDVPMTSLITMLGAISLAVGLAVQDSLSNLAGGFILLFSKPFKVGDYVDISGQCGTVKHINILHTKLLTVDNKSIVIPNGQVSTAKIINYSSEELRRLDLVFSVDYSSNINLAKDTILSILEKNSMALKEPAPLVRVGAFNNSSIDIFIKVWVKGSDYWDLNYDLLEQIKEGFDNNNIIIPFNKLDVNIFSK